jgi:hypothetical protein
LKKRGENTATREDLNILTTKVKDIEILYSQQMEDYKAEIARRSKAVEVADFFAAI